MVKRQHSVVHGVAHSAKKRVAPRPHRPTLITKFASIASRKHAEKQITARQQTRILTQFSGHVEEGYW